MKIFKNPFFWPVVIFICASFFRIFYMDLIEFKADEAYALYLINNFFLNPHIAPYSAPSNTGMHSMPFSLYLVTFLSILVRDPVFLSFMIAFLNSIIIVVFYFVLKKTAGNLIAILAALFLSFSPWPILFSRKIWGPDLMLYFLIPLFYFLHQLIVNKETKRSWILFLLLTLLPQVHFSGLYFILATIAIFFILKVKINFKQAIFGILLGLIPALPYIFYNLFSNPFCPDCTALFSYPGKARIFDLQSFLRPFQLLNGSYFDNPLGRDYGLFLNNFSFIKIFNYIFYIEYLFPIIGSILIFKYQRKYLFFVLYAILIPLFYFLTRTPPYMYYYVILIPVIIFLFVYPFKYYFNKLKPPLNFVVIFLFLTLLSINFIFEKSFYKFLNQKQVINGDYGPVFSKTKEFINKETMPYILLPYYNELKIYAYFYAYPEILNGRLGYFFMQKGRADLAIEEFKKGISINPKDTFSRANLAYILIANNKIDEAKEQIDILEKDDATAAAKLKELINTNLPK